MPAGRPPKPTAQHELDGTFRSDRHGDRADLSWLPGKPVKPKGLDEDSNWLWDLVVGQLPEGARAAVDAVQLIALCNWWRRYTKYARMMDEEIGNPMHVSCMECMAWKNFTKLAAEFGLSPAARTRLKVSGAQPKKAKPSEFFNDRLA